MNGYGAFAEYYDLLTENVGYARRAAYFDTLVRRFAPERQKGLLLDLACGTGSLSLELDALGYEVIGTDASEDMLSVAMHKAMERERRILYLHQSMTDLDLYGTVDVAVCALDSLNHLTSEKALQKTLQKVSLFLEPGGLFLFDVNTVYKHRTVLADNVFVYEMDDVYCVWQNRWQPDNDQVDISLDFFIEDDGGKYTRRTERFTERVFPPAVLESALLECGLELLAKFDGDTTDSPKDTTQRVVYVAKRKQKV